MQCWKATILHGPGKDDYDVTRHDTEQEALDWVLSRKTRFGAIVSWNEDKDSKKVNPK